MLSFGQCYHFRCGPKWSDKASSIVTKHQETLLKVFEVGNRNQSKKEELWFWKPEETGMMKISTREKKLHLLHFSLQEFCFSSASEKREEQKVFQYLLKLS